MTHALIAVWIIKTHLSAFTIMLSEITIYAQRDSQYSIILIFHLHTIRNVTDDWPMAREYSVWNAAVAALQFWTADLEVHVLSSTYLDILLFFFKITMIIMMIMCNLF